jgi:hypothetical protein
MNHPEMTPESQYNKAVAMKMMEEESNSVMAVCDTAEKFVQDDDCNLNCEQLTEDIFSIIYTVKFCSAAFCFAVYVFLFQLTVITLILVDLIDVTSTNNPLKIPAGVVTEVRIAQCLALVLSVARQQDVLTSSVFLVNGYNKDVLESLPSATLGKWLLAGCFQFMAGSSLYSHHAKHGSYQPVLKLCCTSICF